MTRWVLTFSVLVMGCQKHEVRDLSHEASQALSVCCPVKASDSYRPEVVEENCQELAKLGRGAAAVSIASWPWGANCAKYVAAADVERGISAVGTSGVKDVDLFPDSTAQQGLENLMLYPGGRERVCSFKSNPKQWIRDAAQRLCRD